MSMQNEHPPLTAYSEEQRQAAMVKYKIIAPYLTDEKTLTVITEETGIAKRTLQYWIRDYKQLGLKGLIRKTRSDDGEIHLEPEIVVLVEQLILKNKRNSLTSIHRREASYPNEIWQADHTPLDIIVLNEKGKPERPWLTIILDDYSRAVAGYFSTFENPSAIHTSLVLHQAIWRKNNPEWQICGIPEIFYTDHGSDFTSNHLEQVAIDLKINLVFSTVGVPRGRGKIERFFLTINQLFLQDLPGYLGNQVSNSLLTISVLTEFSTPVFRVFVLVIVVTSLISSAYSIV